MIHGCKVVHLTSCWRKLEIAELIYISGVSIVICYGNIRQNIRKKTDRPRELRSRLITDNRIKETDQASKDIDTFFEDEEKLWGQRAKVDCIFSCKSNSKAEKNN